MTTAIQTAFPHPGDANYVDHVATALSRLPQQFKTERLVLPSRPLLVVSVPCGVAVDPTSALQVITIDNPDAALEGDCALLITITDDAVGVPDPLLLPDGWETIAVTHTDNEQVVSILRHFVLPYEDPRTEIFLSGSGTNIQSVLLVYRYINPSSVVSVSAVDVDASVLTPTHFLCPSRQIVSTTDLYVGVTWFMNATGVSVTIPVGSEELVRAVQSVSGTPMTMLVFDQVFQAIGSTGVRDTIVNTLTTGVAASFVLRFELPEFDTLNDVGKLVSALCAPIQSLWDTMMQVLLQRTLITATGAQLDVIGKLVGRARDGLDDDTYRRYCRATIAAHRSRGTVDELINIARLVLFEPTVTIEVTPQQVATVTVDLLDEPVSDDLARVVFVFLRQAASVGVRVILRYGNTDPVFRLDLSPGLDQGRLGGEISD